MVLARGVVRRPDKRFDLLHSKGWRHHQESLRWYQSAQYRADRQSPAPRVPCQYQWNIERHMVPQLREMLLRFLLLFFPVAPMITSRREELRQWSTATRQPNWKRVVALREVTAASAVQCYQQALGVSPVGSETCRSGFELAFACRRCSFRIA